MYEAQAAFCEFRDWRTSVMEISHRSDEFMEIYHDAEAQLRRLMGIGDDYAVLFLTGGATGHAAAIPLNLAAAGDTAAYLISGHWSRRALSEAKPHCCAQVVGDSGETEYATLPAAAADIPADAAYLHIVENETVHGLEYPQLPESPVPIVSDMSSNIITRRLDISDYGLIYAGAQKNLGITGVTIVIVRRDLVKPQPHTPSVWDYQKQQKAESMYNTPPVFQIYMTGRVLAWTEQMGGIAAMEKANAAKAKLLYDYLDSSSFYRPHVKDSGSRSRINIPFFLADEQLTADFLAAAEARGLLGLKGHAVLGGIRASLYNSMPLAGVAALVEHMRDFEQQRG